LGYKINYIAFTIFFLSALALGIFGVIGIFVSLEPESSGETEIGDWAIIWAITAVFGFLSVVFYKKTH